MSKTEKVKKILNYIAMVCTVISAVIFFIDHNWFAAIWALIALIWIADSHLTNDSYYSCKESLNKLAHDYINTLIKHNKELKELKDEIQKLSI